MEYSVLENGVKIPMLGFGVYRLDNEIECEKVVTNAIEAGYRHIDTASAYGNETAVGKAIAKSNVKREDLFITTKLWVTDTNYNRAKDGFYRSMDKLGVDYIDLYLIHQPYNDYYGAWRAMEELYCEGKIRAIGVDNFSQVQLADFITFNKIKPLVNLVESNVFYQRSDDLLYMQSKNVQMEAWSPFGAGNKNIFENKVLTSLSHKYNKTVAQIILRWLLQRGIVSLCKSSNIDRMRENLNIFDFCISDEDMALIATLDTNKSCFPERNNGKLTEQFLEKAKYL